jgi:hypothetical protein
MRLKTFILIFLCFALIVIGSAGIIFLQMQTMEAVRLGVLEDRLYAEDASILSWAMKNLDPEKIDPAGLPSSWGAIMIVDNETLVVKTSTSKPHQGMKLSEVPELLDQAAPVLAAIGKSSPEKISTKDYMIVLTPYAQGSTLIGVKPKAWEKGLIAEQGKSLQRGTKTAAHMLLGYLGAGFAFALILSLVITFVTSLPMSQVAKAFEELSLGNFDADLPRSGGKKLASLSDSFCRLRTSLKYALEKLGRG